MSFLGQKKKKKIPRPGIEPGTPRIKKKKKKKLAQVGLEPTTFGSLLN